MHSIAWHIPSPLWKKALADSDTLRFARPELLRFDTDAFMDELTGRIVEGESYLEQIVAREESWRSRQSGWVSSTGNAAGFDPDRPIKLFQPAHLRYYLVGANLVCQRHGLPDKAIATADDEATRFVVRRLVPRQEGVTVVASNPSTYTEHGWFGEEAGWKPLATPDQVDILQTNEQGDPVGVQAEERLPLFPISHTDANTGNKRRLLAGLIPVARREVYEAGTSDSPPAIDPDELVADPLNDARYGVYESGFSFGMLALHNATGPGMTSENIRDPFAFGLLDLMLFLNTYLNDLFQALYSEDDSDLNAGSDEARVFSRIQTGIETMGLSLPILAALYDARTTILEGGVDFSGNVTLTGSLSGLNPLTTVLRNNIQAGINDFDIIDTSTNPDTIADPEETGTAANTNALIRRLLESSPVEFETEEPLASDDVASRLDPRAGSIYVIRCLYERPRCRRADKRQIVSNPTQPFQMAPFFDSDAPVRPAKIALPVDTSIAGLRNFPKNVSFLLSDELRKQMSRIDGCGVSDVEDGNIKGEGGISLGMICSLSIPIITICAFILLLIIVQLLNIVFWWIPFFKICFPIPLKK